jgi:hypothetical protein
MCEDCRLEIDEVVEDRKHCTCPNCRAGGFVIAIDWDVRSGLKGLAPWCAGCHHYISTSKPSGSH